LSGIFVMGGKKTKKTKNRKKHL